MELEKLNTTQVVLLVLLVSFVTSIATGIATVSLMEKAPADVTRIISRIVEKPIETIVPGEKEVVTQTVVVRESEMIAQAVSQILPSVVRVYRTSGRDLVFQGFGIIVSGEGRVLTNKSFVEKNERYTIALQSGAQLSGLGLDVNDLHGYIQLEASADVALAQLPQVSLVPYDTLELGESVIAIGGGATPAISSGIVSALLPATPETNDMPLIKASVQSGQLVPGSPLIDLDGKVVGIVYDANGPTFTPLLLASPITTE